MAFLFRSGGIDYRLLGPTEVRIDGQVLGIGGLKQRALLTMLLLRANEPVSRDVLVEQLWGHHPPAGAPHTIEVYVSRLRKVLAVAVGQPVVATRPAAYLLQAAQDELDVHRAECLAREGRHELAGAPGAAAHEAWQSALQVLDDLNHPHAASLRARLKALADSASAGHNRAFADDSVSP